MNTLLSVVSGSNLIGQLLTVLLVGICVAIVYAMGRWFIAKLTPATLAMTIWNGFFILVGGIIVINFLLGLSGHPLYNW